MSNEKIEISINNEKKTVDEKSTLAQVLNQLNIDKRMISIAVNSDFVPKDQYDQLMINENDLIDVLTPIAGG